MISGYSLLPLRYIFVSLVSTSYSLPSVISLSLFEFAFLWSSICLLKMWREEGKWTEKKWKWEIRRISLNGIGKEKQQMGPVWWNLRSFFSLSYLQAVIYSIYLRSHWNSHFFGSSTSDTPWNVGLLKRAQQLRDRAYLRSPLWNIAGKLWGHSPAVLWLWSHVCWYSSPVLLPA